MEISKITTGRLILIIGLIIIILPFLLTQPAIFDFLNLGAKSEIGDALGGITSPFINGIAAILVFIAFKEQVKANNLLKEQQYFQHIQEQIYRLEDDFLNLSEVVNNIKENIRHSVVISKVQLDEKTSQ